MVGRSCSDLVLSCVTCMIRDSVNMQNLARGPKPLFYHAKGQLKAGKIVHISNSRHVCVTAELLVHVDLTFVALLLLRRITCVMPVDAYFKDTSLF